MNLDRHRTLRTLFLAICLAVAPRLGLSQDSQGVAPPQEKTVEPTPPAEVKLTDEAQAEADRLRAQLPTDSEAIRMLDQIIAGSQLGPGEGWFDSTERHTRFDWAWFASTYDADADGMVTMNEFDVPKPEFSSVDQNGDRAITELDFNWSEPSTSRTVGTSLFAMADANANGKVSMEEFEGLFRRLDSGDTGFLSLDDVRGQFLPPPESARETRPDKPSPSTLVMGLARQEIGSLQSGPEVDATLIDFTLKSLDGDTVTLSEQIGEQPVVLIFGNFTCGPFRSQAGNIEKFYGRYRDRAKFFMIYVREAHPAEGWWMTSNNRVGIKVSQPQTSEERVEVAARCREHLELISDLPFLVDDINDTAGAAYSGMPNRLYIIDSAGKIAFKNGRGPFGFKLRELEQALALLLHATQSDDKQE